MKPTRLVCSMALAGLASVAPLAGAQDAPDASTPQRVVITGSAIPRFVGEGALPVTVISHEDIERTGAKTAEDLVGLIPSNFGGTVTSENVGATGIASTANLRGLGDKYTLVLLNGRRVADFGFGNTVIDLNSIPLSAVERVEVLRDGASAIYGADAVAGVINFILKKDFRGIEVSGEATDVQHGGGNNRSVSLLAGFGDLATDRFNVLLSLSREDKQRLRATQRPFAATGVRPDLGLEQTTTRNGIPNVSFIDTRGNEYGTGNVDVPQLPQVNPLRYNGCNAPGYALVVNDETTCATDYVQFIDIFPKVRHDSATLSGTLQADAKTQVFLEAMRTEDKIVSTYSPAPYFLGNLYYPQGGRFYPAHITLPAGMTLPAGYVMPDGSVLAADTVLASDMDVTPTGPIGGRYRTVAGGGRTDLTDNRATRFVFGVRGDLADWEYEAAVTAARFDGMISFGPGQYSNTRLAAAIESGDINIFGPQDAQSQQALDGARLSGPENWSTSDATTLDFRASNTIARLPAGPLDIAVGAAYRKEQLSQVSSATMLVGDDVGGNGPVPGVTGGRDVTSVFTELSVPVVRHLDLQAAARYDSYKNSFGVSFDNVSPKLGLRYQPEKAWLFRASVARGFRAPTLYENLRPFTEGGGTANNYSDPLRCPGGVPIDATVGALQDECNIQLTTATQGEKNLKPEKSRQFTLGAVVAPSRDFSASLDYWNVTINDAIVQLPEQAVFADPAKYDANFYRYDPGNPLYSGGYTFDCGLNACGNLVQGNGAQNSAFPLAYVYLPYMNAARKYAAGVDVGLDYKLPVSGQGRVGFALDGTLFVRHGYQYTGTPSVSDLGAYKDFGVAPRWRHSATVSYDAASWGVSITNDYTASYLDFTDSTLVGDGYPAQRRVRAASTWDLRTTWSPTKKMDLAFGIRNLLDTDPPTSRNSAFFQAGYDPQYSDPRGRTFFVSARYRFL